MQMRTVLWRYYQTASFCHFALGFGGLSWLNPFRLGFERHSSRNLIHMAGPGKAWIWTGFSSSGKESDYVWRKSGHLHVWQSPLNTPIISWSLADFSKLGLHKIHNPDPNDVAISLHRMYSVVTIYSSLCMSHTALLLISLHTAKCRKLRGFHLRWEIRKGMPHQAVSFLLNSRQTNMFPPLTSPDAFLVPTFFRCI